MWVKYLCPKGSKKIMGKYSVPMAKGRKDSRVIHLTVLKQRQRNVREYVAFFGEAYIWPPFKTGGVK